MGAIRLSLNLLGLLFAAGSTLLLFFIVLAGSSHGKSNVLTKWYWVAGDTSSIKNATYPISRWSLYGICGYDGSNAGKPGNFIGCTKNKPAYPFDLTRNFGGDIPDEFRSGHNASYYESRFAFAFYLIALFFQVVSMFVSLVAAKSRIIGLTSSLTSLVAFIFAATAASLSTVVAVHARDNFHKIGATAKLGQTLIAFAWTVTFLTFVNFIIFLFTSPKGTGSKKGAASQWKGAAVPGLAGAPAKKRSGYRFGIGSKKTTDGPSTKAETSSFVRA